jgi:DNA-binding LacI/PurR family transcriptional regulator
MKKIQQDKVTIKDVARACGVSTQTISRVLNDRVDVSQDTREKVLAVIEQMGYQPNAFARGMRQRSTTLGVIITGLQHKGISTTLKGITLEAEKNGLNLILKELSSFKTSNIKSLINSLMAHQVMGIIYAAPEVDDNWTHFLRNLPQHCPPMVFLKGSPSSAPITISIDNYIGAYTMTQHLIEQGYSHIGHISGPLSWFEARERKRGWSQALKDAGMTTSLGIVAEGSWGPESGQTAFEYLFNIHPEMDAIFVANDQMALAVLHSAWQNGINVPDQLAVAGYDGISESAFFIPPLTTIRQDFRGLGAMAVNKIKQLQDPGKTSGEIIPDSAIITPELIARQSTLRVR